jgi:hypothetical protein
LQSGLNDIKPWNCVILHLFQIQEHIGEQGELSCEIEMGKSKLDGFVSEGILESISSFCVICNSEFSAEMLEEEEQLWQTQRNGEGKLWDKRHSLWIQQQALVLEEQEWYVRCEKSSQQMSKLRQLLCQRGKLLTPQPQQQEGQQLALQGQQRVQLLRKHGEELRQQQQQQQQQKQQPPEPDELQQQWDIEFREVLLEQKLQLQKHVVEEEKELDKERRLFLKKREDLDKKWREWEQEEKLSWKQRQLLCNQ